MTSDGVIQLPTDSTGKYLDTTTLSVNGKEVHRERMVLGGSASASLVEPINVAPVGSEYAVPTRNIPYGSQSVLVVGTATVTGTVNQGSPGAAWPIFIQDPTTPTSQALVTDSVPPITGMGLVVRGLPFTTGALPSAPSSSAIGTTSSVIIASNSARVRVIVQNTGVTTIYLGLGGTPTNTNYHLALHPGSAADDGYGTIFIDEMWRGVVNAISSAPLGKVVVMEMT